jgi:hypothetical protein
MCSFWSEVIAEREQQQRSLPRRPTIPQQAPEPDTGIGVLSTPTSVFGERQSLTPGTDFAAVLSRRHAPAEPPARGPAVSTAARLRWPRTTALPRWPS